MFFWAWVEDWEEKTRKRNDCVARAQLLAKYKGLVFHNPNSGKSFSIWEHNMEFQGEVMDGSLLVFVLKMKTIMRHSYWRLHVN
jgi:hypothetical protein